MWAEFFQYAFTKSENSLAHLAVVISAAIGLFMFRQIRSYLALKRARKTIPLTIGGWGTRGKSGTERLKAALFEALGFELLAKTTGNEAMFIHSVPDQKPMEIFIFRPYDKATIWEQLNVTKLAGDLKVHVMTWECMALNPRYVRILQQSWMRDEYATITNCYPDHEDIQGPAGWNIPQVMTNFIPKNAVVFTAEEQMLPILRDDARRKNTTLHAATWRDVFFVTDDILNRFPYDEHPANVALVTLLGENLGLERDYILKELADNVVPDMGVLKTYPTATYLGRRLSFTLGNSANERQGFMNNWVRSGFNEHDNVENADVWITTCVNNRADRVARSKVFADILVMDISAHRHFLIGTNLTGMVGYIEGALHRRAENYYLIHPSEVDGLTPETASEKASAAMRQLFVDLKVEAFEEEDLSRKLQRMLEGIEMPFEHAFAIAQDVTLLEKAIASTATLDAYEVTGKTVASDPQLEEACTYLRERLTALESEWEIPIAPEILDAVVEWFEYYARMYRSVRNFIEAIQSLLREGISASTIERVNELARQFLTRVFEASLDVLEDPYMTGDQIIDHIARHSPPGFLIRIMGAQNIKGTGLDFAYRWLAVDKVAQNIQKLESNDAVERMEAIRWFGQFKDYGILGCPLALEALERAKSDPNNQSAGAQQQIDAAIAHVAEQYELAKQRLGETTKRDTWSVVFELLEQILDARDSRRRRRQADRILRELIQERISHQQAEVLLRELTKRQKGGWLEREIRGRFQRRRKQKTRAA